MIVLRMAKEARAHFLVRAGEWFMAGEMAFVGGWLLLMNDTFGSAKAYAIMARLAGEHAWEILLLSIAASRAAALFINGSMPTFSLSRYSAIIRGLLAIVSGMAWCSIGMSVFLVNPKSIFVPLIFGLALGDFVLSAIIADEAGLVEKRARDAGRS